MANFIADHVFFMQKLGNCCGYLMDFWTLDDNLIMNFASGHLFHRILKFNSYNEITSIWSINIAIEKLKRNIKNKKFWEIIHFIYYKQN